jgi:hypothetical protein
VPKLCTKGTCAHVQRLEGGDMAQHESRYDPTVYKTQPSIVDSSSPGVSGSVRSNLAPIQPEISKGTLDFYSSRHTDQTPFQFDGAGSHPKVAKSLCTNNHSRRSPEYALDDSTGSVL